jgi:hypothetical protein
VAGAVCFQLIGRLRELGGTPQGCGTSSATLQASSKSEGKPKKEGTTMKSLTAMMVAAAAMTVVAGVASAQTMKAKVPFEFRAAGNAMPAGSYDLRTSQAGPVATIIVRNTDTNKAIMLLPMAPVNVSANDTEAKLVFSCAGSDCSLASLWTGTERAYAFSTPRAPKYLQAEIRVVTVHLEKTE